MRNYDNDVIIDYESVLCNAFMCSRPQLIGHLSPDDQAKIIEAMKEAEKLALRR